MIVFNRFVLSKGFKTEYKILTQPSKICFYNTSPKIFTDTTNFLCYLAISITNSLRKFLSSGILSNFLSPLATHCHILENPFILIFFGFIEIKIEQTVNALLLTWLKDVVSHGLFTYNVRILGGKGGLKICEKM